MTKVSQLILQDDPGPAFVLGHSSKSRERKMPSIPSLFRKKKKNEENILGHQLHRSNFVISRYPSPVQRSGSPTPLRHQPDRSSFVSPRYFNPVQRSESPTPRTGAPSNAAHSRFRSPRKIREFVLGSENKHTNNSLAASFCSFKKKKKAPVISSEEFNIDMLSKKKSTDSVKSEEKKRNLGEKEIVTRVSEYSEERRENTPVSCREKIHAELRSIENELTDKASESYMTVEKDYDLGVIITCGSSPGLEFKEGAKVSHLKEDSKEVSAGKQLSGDRFNKKVENNRDVGAITTSVSKFNEEGIKNIPLSRPEESLNILEEPTSIKEESKDKVKFMSVKKKQDSGKNTTLVPDFKEDAINKKSVSRPKKYLLKTFSDEGSSEEESNAKGMYVTIYTYLFHIFYWQFVLHKVLSKQTRISYKGLERYETKIADQPFFVTLANYFVEGSARIVAGGSQIVLGTTQIAMHESQNRSYEDESVCMKLTSSDIAKRKVIITRLFGMLFKDSSLFTLKKDDELEVPFKEITSGAVEIAEKRDGKLSRDEKLKFHSDIKRIVEILFTHIQEQMRSVVQFSAKKEMSISKSVKNEDGESDTIKDTTEGFQNSEAGLIDSMEFYPSTTFCLSLYALYDGLQQAIDEKQKEDQHKHVTDVAPSNPNLDFFHNEYEFLVPRDANEIKQKRLLRIVWIEALKRIITHLWCQRRWRRLNPMLVAMKKIQFSI